MSTPAAAPAEGAAPPKAGKKKLVIIVAVLVLALGGGGGAFFMMKKKAAEAEEAAGEDGHAKTAKKDKKKDEKVLPVFVPLDPFTVNLADRETERFAQVGITLEIDDAKTGDQLKAYMPAIRNNILMTLAQKTAAELQTVEGKEKRHILLMTRYRHGVAVTSERGRRRMPLPIELCVIDDGPGAPDDLADQLFDPFISSKRKGQGLGLALADKLVRDMGGIIQYTREGQPPRTVFRLLLQRAEGEIA